MFILTMSVQFQLLGKYVIVLKKLVMCETRKCSLIFDVMKSSQTKKNSYNESIQRSFSYLSSTFKYLFKEIILISLFLIFKLNRYGFVYILVATD